MAKHNFKIGDRVVVKENNVNASLGKAVVISTNYKPIEIEQDFTYIRIRNERTGSFSYVPSLHVVPLRYIKLSREATINGLTFNP